MKKYLYVLIAWMLPLCSIHAQAPVWNPDNGNGTFTNPIMWGDWPDPDVIRVAMTSILSPQVCIMFPVVPLPHRKIW